MIAVLYHERAAAAFGVFVTCPGQILESLHDMTATTL